MKFSDLQFNPHPNWPGIQSTHLFHFIEDNIKYNRYQEAVKEYRQCAQKYQDEHSVRVYCGDPPSSTIMI